MRRGVFLSFPILAALTLAPAAVHAQAAAQAIWAEGQVTAVDPDAGRITLAHAPIPEIGWPAMTMAFEAGPEVDLSAIETGEEVRFQLTPVGDGMFRVDQVTPADGSGG